MTARITERASESKSPDPCFPSCLVRHFAALSSCPWCLCGKSDPDNRPSKGSTTKTRRTPGKKRCRQQVVYCPAEDADFRVWRRCSARAKADRPSRRSESAIRAPSGSMVLSGTIMKRAQTPTMTSMTSAYFSGGRYRLPRSTLPFLTVVALPPPLSTRLFLPIFFCQQTCSPLSDPYTTPAVSPGFSARHRCTSSGPTCSLVSKQCLGKFPNSTEGQSPVSGSSPDL